MKPIQYFRPLTVADACTITGEGIETAFIAGGTDLLIEFRKPGANVPSRIVDISGIAELKGITDSGEEITIGPLTTHTELLESDLLRQFAPFLPGAAATIGSPQIRNRGTIGGNIMNAAACADTVPPLVALGASVILRSLSGTREVPIASFFVKPYTTAARPGELLTAIRFPKMPLTARFAFIKLGRRNALAISRLSVAAILEISDGGIITDARIVPGAAFPAWKRITAAEAMLKGRKPSDDLFTAAGATVSAEMIRETGRRWSTEYKEPVIGVLVRRALQQCVKSRPPLRHPSRKRPVGPIPPGDGKAITSAKNDATVRIRTTINKRTYDISIRTGMTLLELLRDQIGLTGTKCGCQVGECGACTVLLDGLPVNSCLVLAAQIAGHEITTIEGLGTPGHLHPLQESFLEHDAAHCGFCTPGMIMSAEALLRRNPSPTEAEIRTAISGNLCRCSGYVQIVDAIHNTKS